MKYELYPKRDPIKNYFPLPNEIFTLELKPGEIAVYAFLLRCEDRKTFKCYPSFKTIAKALNVSKNTVRKYVETLYEKHLIDIENTYIFSKDGKKLNGNLLYTILPIDEAVNFHLQKQLKKLGWKLFTKIFIKYFYWKKF